MTRADLIAAVLCTALLVMVAVFSRWHRFLAFGPGARLHELAEPYVNPVGAS